MSRVSLSGRGYRNAKAYIQIHIFSPRPRPPRGKRREAPQPRRTQRQRVGKAVLVRSRRRGPSHLKSSPGERRTADRAPHRAAHTTRFPARRASRVRVRLYTSRYRLPRARFLLLLPLLPLVLLLSPPLLLRELLTLLLQELGSPGLFLWVVWVRLLFGPALPVLSFVAGAAVPALVILARPFFFFVLLVVVAEDFPFVPVEDV